MELTLCRTQPGVSRLPRGDFRECSLERLLCLLTTLGGDILIRQPRSATGGELRSTAEQTA